MENEEKTIKDKVLGALVIIGLIGIVCTLVFVLYSMNQTKKEQAKLAKQHQAAMSSQEEQAAVAADAQPGSAPAEEAPKEVKAKEQIEFRTNSGAIVAVDYHKYEGAEGTDTSEVGEDTYIEVNLTAQRLYFYEDGDMIYSTQIVSGDEKTGMDTPCGLYYTGTKATEIILQYNNAEEYVHYWVPISNELGIVSATWRIGFGGDIYKENGSFGSIQISEEAAEVIYDELQPGIPVYVYQLDGTEESASSEELFNTDPVVYDDNSAYDDSVWVGDSRFVGIQNIRESQSDVFIAQEGAGWSWFEDSALPQLDKLLKSNPNRNVFINMGINDIVGKIAGDGTDHSSDYAQQVNALVQQYPAAKFFYVSLNPVGKDYHSAYGTLTKDTMTNAIQAFNDAVRTQCQAEYIDCYTYLNQIGFQTGDGIHFDSQTNQHVYSYVKSCLKPSNLYSGIPDVPVLQMKY